MAALDRKNVTLIGMPGSGKSTLGRLLAMELGYRFVDGDDLIRAGANGRDLQQIIKEDGEEEFLRLEAEALCSVHGEGMVIAPGGSCVLSPAPMEHLRKISLVIYLPAPLEVILRRLGDASGRGIVGAPPCRDEACWNQALIRLHEVRKPLYERYAHVHAAFPDRDPPHREAVALLRAICLDYHDTRRRPADRRDGP